MYNTDSQLQSKYLSQVAVIKKTVRNMERIHLKNAAKEIPIRGLEYQTKIRQSVSQLYKHWI